MPWTPPASAESVAIRPLNQGVHLDGSSLMLPPGSMLQSDNFISNLEGYRRRPGYETFALGETVPYRCVDMLSTRDEDGVEVTLLLTTHSLFLVNSRTGYTEVAWAYATGTITVDDDEVTGDTTDWITAGILPGDVIRVGTEETPVLTRGDATSITIASGGLTDGTGLSYSIQRTFTPGRLHCPVWVRTPDGVAIADGKHELLWYDVSANTIDYWIDAPGKQPPNGATIPAVVGYAADRVFIGNISDSVDGDRALRILWSGLADYHDFDFPENWQDFPQFSGQLMRIIPLRDNLMLYFTDGLYAGAPTNFPSAPYRYVRIETGPLGLVGPYAVAPYIGGHFFISQNGFYFTDSQGFQDMSTPISRAIQANLDYPEWSQVCADPLNYSVLFGIPTDAREIGEIWRFDPRSKSWSRDTTPTEMIANPIVNAALSWNDLAGNTWATLGATYPTWDSFKIQDTQRRVIVENNRALYRGTAYGTQDYGTSPITAVLVTPDHDLNAPDESKTFVRLGVKITSEATRENTVVLAIEGSGNRGRTWKRLGNLVIPVDRDEGYVNFRLTSSTIRFRLTAASVNVSYFISEYTMRYCGAGEEADVSLHG